MTGDKEEDKDFTAGFFRCPDGGILSGHKV